MQKHLMFKVLIGLLMLVVAACAAGPTEFIIVDQRETLGDVFSEKTTTLDNSNGDDFLVQDLAVLREFRHSMQIRINEGANVDRQRVEERILDTYDLPDRSGQKTCLVPADVPPNSVYQYELEWTEIIREGNIEEGTTAGGRILGTYTVVVDLQCQTVGAVALQ